MIRTTDPHGVENSTTQRDVTAGHDLALTSTMSNERSQHFYRRLVMSTPEPYCCPTNPAELILRKPLAQ